MMAEMDSFREGVVRSLAQHDSAIGTLGGRMSGVEAGLKNVQGEMHHGFVALGSKLDRFDGRPTFDFHKTTTTIVAIAVLFSMICGGIIYITNSQNAALLAEQKSFNSTVAKTLDRHDTQIDKLSAWSTTISKGR